MLFPASENCCYLFQLLTNHCLTITFPLWFLDRALVANYGITQRKTCWLIKTIEVFFSWYKWEYILILNTYQFWYIIPEITLHSFSPLFYFVQILLRTITSLQHSEVTGCFSHWTVLSKWSIFNTVLPFISNFRCLILHFFNKMLRKKKAKAIGQWEHSHGI